jgi:hypothetical protein
LTHSKGVSRTGIIGLICGGVIFGISRKQDRISDSSAEAELIALHDAGKLTARVYNLLSELIGHTTPIPLLEDNQSTIKLIKNGQSNSGRTAHIEKRYFFTKQFQDDGKLKLTHCPTELNLADGLTKILTGTAYEQMVNTLLIDFNKYKTT